MKSVAVWIALSVVFIAAETGILVAQGNDVVIDWSTKQLQAWPTTVDYVTQINVRVINVNDLLYDYSGRVAAKPRSTSDLFAPLGDLINPAAGPTASLIQHNCPGLDTLVQTLQKKYNALLPAADKPKSIALSDTIAAWSTDVAPVVEQIRTLLTQYPGCNQGTVADQLHQLFVIVDAWTTKLRSSHEFTFPTQLSPDNDYTVYIDEKYNGTPTDIGEQSFSFSPQSSLVTVSGGFLFTQLQGRSYERRDVPTASGTQTGLGVIGSGPVRPVFTSTINVKLPYLENVCSGQKCWNTHKLGLALSIGPAFQFGTGSSNVSKLGLFGGLSLVIADKAYLTPGVHVGEFADYPLGFDHSGQPIPMTFTQQLTPVTRNTARFGFAITFKGFNLLKSNSGAKSKQGKPGK